MTVTGIHFPDTMADVHRGGQPAGLVTSQRKPLPSVPNSSVVDYQQAGQRQYTQSTPLQAAQFNGSRRADSSSSSHSRSRTGSSQIFSNPVTSPASSAISSSRRFSCQSSSTTGYSGNQPGTAMSQAQPDQAIYRSATNNSINSTTTRRSTSSRSSALPAPTSYVALMRKQKATVWCDRSQTLDPRTTAAQKAAKQRAALEVHGTGSGRASTIASTGGKVRSAKNGAYIPANLSGVSVPVRLSANEMFGDEEEVVHDGKSMTDSVNRIHTRSGSGRSSVHSGKYLSGYPRPAHHGGGRFSSGSTPPSGNEDSSPGKENIPAVPEGRPSTNQPSSTDYFADTQTLGEEDSFGEVAELKSPLSRQSAVAQAAEQAKKAEELRRRGSVDERTMTLGGKGRLFVANPDN
jgi:hypothetical protein